MGSSDPSSSSLPTSVYQESHSLSYNDEKESKNAATPTPEQCEAACFARLIKSEIDFPSVGSFDGSPVVLPDILEQARLKVERFEAIHWILKTKIVYNLKHETAFLAVAYMDRFLSRAYKKEFLWLTGLVAAACLAIALQKEERKRLPLQAIRRVAFRDLDLLKSMMFFALTKLGQKINLVTPFPYIPYFISKLGVEDPSEKLISATALIFKTLEAINLIDYRPSIIAVAAVLAVAHPKLSGKQLESTIGDLSLWEPQEIEPLFPCFRFMMKRLYLVQKMMPLPAPFPVEK